MTAIAFFAKLIYLIPALLGFALLRAWRWVSRGFMVARAQGWPRTDATVESSFELDESSKRVRNLIKNLFDDQLDQHRGLQAPEMKDIYDDDYGNDKSRPWISGIHYSYCVNGIRYSGTYLLPAAHMDSRSATKAARAWISKRIVIRYKERRPAESYFLKMDGAPGLARIPAGVDTEPYVTTLSLK